MNDTYSARDRNQDASVRARTSHVLRLLHRPPYDDTINQMRQKLLFAAACLLCAAICWRSFLRFEGTEFGGGTLAGGSVLTAFLYLLALALVFKYPRAASLIALYSCFESLPLYLYLVFPRPFRQVWPGQWRCSSYPAKHSFGMAGGSQQSSLRLLSGSPVPCT